MCDIVLNTDKELTALNVNTARKVVCVCSARQKLFVDYSELNSSDI